jgi:uncharacterized surface protein with fasciclin (FAS1) repeats
MFRTRDADEVRRFDLMKLAVLVAMLLMLVLTWFLFREQSAPSLVSEEMIATPLATAIDESVVIAPGEEEVAGGEAVGETGAEATAEISGEAAGEAGEEMVVATPVTEGGAEITTPVAETPVISPPPDALSTGSATLSGTAAPGSQVFLLVDGQPFGVATAGVDGTWSLPTDLPAGTYTVQAQVMDNLGNVSGESAPLTVVVREAEELGTGDSLVNVPSVDPETGSFLLTGTAAPGSMVTLSNNGTILGAVTADESGNWVASVEPSVSGDVAVETVDSAGNVISSTVSLPAAEDTAGAETDAPEESTTGVEGSATGEAEAAATPTVEQPVYQPQSITGMLSAQPDQFSILLAALEAAGLADEFDGSSPFTLFAPTDVAFEQLPEEVIQGLIANPEALSQVLQYHATRGIYSAADLRVVAPATLNNRLWTITPSGETLLVNNATVIQPDMMATNGAIHVIDRVLVPPLAAGVRPPVIDESGIPTFTGPALTVVGSAQPGSTLLLELNGEPFGSKVVVDPSGFWQVGGEVTPGEYSIVAFMLDASGILQAISQTVILNAQ